MRRHGGGAGSWACASGAAIGVSAVSAFGRSRRLYSWGRLTTAAALNGTSAALASRCSSLEKLPAFVRFSGVVLLLIFNFLSSGMRGGVGLINASSR